MHITIGEPPYSRLKQYEQSVADYNRALEINPEHAEAYFSRGTAKLRIGTI